MLQSVRVPIDGSHTGKLAASKIGLMPAGLPVAFLLFTQAASAGSHAGAQVPAPTETAAANDLRQCLEANGDPNARQIIVCAPKPQGYRIDPDVLAARRMKKKGDPGPPRNPHERFVDHSCANVGPMGCRGGPVIDVVTAAATAATMVQKAIKGENVGKTFVTDPQQSEYQLYLAAKAEREARLAEAAAKKAREAALAAAPTPAKQ